MLSTTQFLIFELGPMCNLGAWHKKCPNITRKPTSPTRLRDDQIIQSIHEARDKFNFTGLVGWHYYNEPMIEHKRMYDIMQKCGGRYVLWTNGKIQPQDDRIGLFEKIVVSQYDDEELHMDYYYGETERYPYKGCKDVQFIKPRFDSRLEDTTKNPPNNRKCFRQHIEMIIDNWGTSHLCCQDWRREVGMGNIHENSFEQLVRVRDVVLMYMSKGLTPKRCDRCKEKMRKLVMLDEEPYKRAMEKWGN